MTVATVVLLSAITGLLLMLTVAGITVAEHLADLKAYTTTVISELQSQSHSIRWSHRKILKTLKGDNYEGDMGGVEMFTDPNIPLGGAVVFDAKAFGRG